ILAVQHPDESARGVLQSRGDMLAIADVAVCYPAREPRDRLAEARRIVGDEEALHPRAEDDQEPWMERRLDALEVVLRHLAADRDARADVQQRVHRSRDTAA